MKESPRSGMPAAAVNRLRNAGVGGGATGHPDADQLSAFAEQSLPAVEREEVLAHLGQCADCREILALSVPQVEEEQAGGRAMARSWFVLRPEFMRWGIVGASAAVVVAAVLLVKPEMERNAISKDVRYSANVQEPVPVSEPAAAPSPSPKPMVQSEEKTKNAEVGTVRGRVRSRQDEQRDAFAANDVMVARKAAPSSGIGAGRGAGIGGGMFGGVMPSQPTGGVLASTVKQENAPLTAPSGSAPAAAERAATAPAPASAAALERTDAKEVKSADKISLADAAKAKSEEQSETATNYYSFEGKAQGHNAAPLAAKDNENAVFKKTMRAVVRTWRIAEGSLQASSDAGASWRPVGLPGGVKALAVDAGRPLASSVWVGGTNGALLQSHDNGATWTQVKGSWTGDVVYVKFASPTTGVLRTSRPGVTQEWGTEDGGKTWKMRYAVGG